MQVSGLSRALIEESAKAGKDLRSYYGPGANLEGSWAQVPARSVSGERCSSCPCSTCQSASA